MIGTGEGHVVARRKGHRKGNPAQTEGLAALRKKRGKLVLPATANNSTPGGDRSGGRIAPRHKKHLAGWGKKARSCTKRLKGKIGFLQGGRIALLSQMREKGDRYQGLPPVARKKKKKTSRRPCSPPLTAMGEGPTGRGTGEENQIAS